MAKKTTSTPEEALAARVTDAVTAKRTRAMRPFPATSFEEAAEFAKQILNYGSGQPVRRLSLFDHIGKSPESGPSRQLVTNANKYGLIKGNFTAEVLEMTPDGRKALDEEQNKREQTKARINLAITNIEPFKKLYDKFVGNKLPAKAALIDSIKEIGVSEDLAEEGIDTFIVNLRYVGLLQTLSGAERIISVDHLLDSLPTTPASSRTVAPNLSVVNPVQTAGSIITTEQAHFESTCFYITPIGEEESEFRKHSDLFLGSIVEPALESFGLKVIRADAIDKPGTITRQIIDYILKSRLVIADLSFHNPNVFYELAIRHAARLPVVQLIRASDRIPFDLSQSRTIKIDTSDIYSLVPRIELYRSEIASQVRRSLEDPDAVDNPISTFYPALRVQLTA